ncbi:SDR family oxidoreductase [Mesorhizobium sp. M7A.F.Ca.CA.001.07.2.1]|uniref:SDR family NAD(P)-dependent oxidoreductase n=4 Tax=Phyllobacteriaceae TaxID=69277 RepID=UPI000FCC876E|nr:MULTISPECIES: SDR family NAD(P)-dependent oxidoreductase [Mesorhizobium]RVB35230.1 SDR family oxidoreductase [Mesorhizobium sp. M7A.F.Ca.CA.004.05.1.1]MCF6121649.1 SDR family oxidoreductase [Mesorhizobium ciceri]MCQ8812228.1 SDR family oxidoreductase [Mesorhizobium sp. SEMIA396]RUX78897.1 SDR family oxidoreductase [Mesorhizobium sp. M7A.F.Ca.CA.004.08.2.1]RUX96308.1 SDR family oxidoreductase [Mesorhizobium sp. M7A.F.Ca.CA.004.04.1.1]
MPLLADKTAIVTGGSSGIGRAIALKFAAEGASVVIADTVEQPIEGGKSTVELIRSAGGGAVYIRTDISDWSAVDALVDATVTQFGRLDVMVNNAAIYTSTNLIDTTPEQWQRVIGVNLTGFFYCSKRAVMQMLTQAPVTDVRGRIINISSQHGIVACPGDFPYSVSKGGIVQMTRQIAVDHADDLIVCNAIAPGKIVTGKPGVANEPDALDYSRRRTPWPRLGHPSDVAGAALFLASDMASYVTGINLMVDGGWMAG